MATCSRAITVQPSSSQLHIAAGSSSYWKFPYQVSIRKREAFHDAAARPGAAPPGGRMRPAIGIYVIASGGAVGQAISPFKEAPAEFYNSSVSQSMLHTRQASFITSLRNRHALLRRGQHYATMRAICRLRQVAPSMPIRRSTAPPAGFSTQQRCAKSATQAFPPPPGRHYTILPCKKKLTSMPYHASRPPKRAHRPPIYGLTRRRFDAAFPLARRAAFL